ncbi:hypothetical protein BDP27DRAFT_513249 [Rhodocollybia butyracea]|uniref:Uncharacterized protein n=1 Tax=Rhodocollybia butyracea TaxID=206335 RepID=A0A9P5PSQ0_9AGAR|nr:hypothetical protein BDP27DRAFT_513249 [Rhodocollybia butyracea]
MRCPGLRIGESLLLLSPFFAVLGSAQQSTSFAPVTLWQVGQGHLLQGSIATLPLEILGAASDGSSTTYLYQAVNLATVTLTTEGKTTTQISPSPTPRTIVASSSGWVERFPSATTTNSIGCFLINSISGACFSGTSIINTGAPTPEVLVVTSLSTSTPTTLPSSAFSKTL